MSREKGGSKADTLVKLVLVFFISLLSFSVGTFVGKQVSDSDHRRLALEGEYKGERDVASTGESHEPSEHGEKITDKEVESLTEEFIAKEKSREPAESSHADHEHDKSADSDDKDEAGYTAYHGRKSAGVPEKVEAHPEKAHVAAPARDAHPESETAKKVVDGKAPSDGHKEERKPQSVLPSVASSAIGKYAVQVASYADEKMAKEHAADMKAKGYEAFYLSANVNGRTWFRVLVGLFDNVKNADNYRATLMKEVGTKSAIVQKIVQ